MSEIEVRPAKPSDYDAIKAVVDDWWGAPVQGGLTRLFLDHFHNTSFVVYAHGHLVAFLVGFLSQGQHDLAYIHYVGVSPTFRRSGVGRELYRRFFSLVHSAGRTRVAAITSPRNTRSIAFHKAMGFSVSEPIDDYDGPGADRVRFDRLIDE
ncbi:GNAT family N-acetyltransferase [Herbidospora cretacea]|uniref:GNAT family N-acetyltransferase n=1 Tax=Herbidospora cretacea TaxID=28444 RepID=UPI0007734143|nr:GNAT family N-acetyltransferase [Herbidospora cretacea]